MRAHVTTYPLLFILLAFTAGKAIANVKLNISLNEPEWQFVLGNPLQGKNEAQLEPAERNFALSIKPLLDEQQYSTILEKFSTRNIEEDSPALQVLRGQILLAVKQYENAANAFEMALQTMPQLANAHRGLSMAHMLEKNYAAARKHLVRSIELGYADAQVYGQLAFINLQKYAAASAIAGYQQAMFLEPENGQWQQGLLYAYLQGDALSQAKSLVEQQLQDDNQNKELWLIRSQIALQQNKWEEALSSLEVALRLGESAAENRLTAAQLHLQNGSVPRGVALLTQNISQLNAKNRDAILPSIETTMSWLAEERQWALLESLIKACNKKKQQIPSRYQARFNTYQAQLALHKGNIQQAQSLLKNTIQLEPSMGDALMALAKVYHQQKQYAQANNYYIRAEALDDFQETALLARAQLEIDRQEYQEALQLLRKVMQINPARHDVASNIRTLENVVRQES
ncbi:Beta-barrel assembly-enhancing protease [Thalassocella blandensis]|nr:Beta-barrel assembly-enhancing protease [Thalassocella blandensis]